MRELMTNSEILRSIMVLSLSCSWDFRQNLAASASLMCPRFLCRPRHGHGARWQCMEEGGCEECG